MGKRKNTIWHCSNEHLAAIPERPRGTTSSNAWLLRHACGSFVGRYVASVDSARHMGKVAGVLDWRERAAGNIPRISHIPRTPGDGELGMRGKRGKFSAMPL
jgi:hypothetical protein